MRFAKGAKNGSLKRYDAVSKKDKAGQQEVKRKRAEELSQYEWKCEIKEQKITTIFITQKGKKT